MSKVTIRKFAIEMLDECVDLYMRTYSQEPWHESWDSRDVVVNFYKNHFANNYFLGYVAVLDEKIVGVSAGFLKPWIKGMEYYIDDFFVSIDHQRQGIGKQFMAAIKDDLIVQDIHAIMLNTERSYPAFQFYESVGFSADDTSVAMYAVF